MKHIVIGFFRITYHIPLFLIDRLLARPLTFILVFLWEFDYEEAKRQAMPYCDFYRYYETSFSKKHKWSYFTFTDMIKGKPIHNPLYIDFLNSIID